MYIEKESDDFKDQIGRIAYETYFIELAPHQRGEVAPWKYSPSWLKAGWRAIASAVFEYSFPALINRCAQLKVENVKLNQEVTDLKKDLDDAKFSSDVILGGLWYDKLIKK